MSRHDPRRRQEDAARRHLRGGIAKAALRQRREGTVRDASGRPLPHALEMSERHGTKNLEGWAAQRTKTIIVL